VIYRRGQTVFGATVLYLIQHGTVGTEKH